MALDQFSQPEEPGRRRRIPKWKLDEDFKRLLSSAQLPQEGANDMALPPLPPAQLANPLVARKAGLESEALFYRVLLLFFGCMLAMAFVAVPLGSTLSFSLLFLGFPALWHYAIGKHYERDSLAWLGFWGCYGATAFILAAFVV